MARMPDDMIITVTPNTAIVDVICKAIDCRFNLVNSSNNPNGREARCNLKQIVIYGGGKCGNYEKVELPGDTEKGAIIHR